MLRNNKNQELACPLIIDSSSILCIKMLKHWRKAWFKTWETKVKFGEERRYLLISYLAKISKEDADEQRESMSCTPCVSTKFVFVYI